MKKFIKRLLYGDPRMIKKRKLLKLMPKHAVCAEIGVWKGDFSKLILKTKPKELHLIDPWEFTTEFGNRLYGGKVAKNQKDMDEIYESIKKKFSNVHREYSDKAVEKFSDKYFDWVYIDANHFYEYVKKDLELYYPKTKTYLTGDDYYWSKSGQDKPVKRAVDEFAEKYNKKVKLVGNQYIIVL